MGPYLNSLFFCLSLLLVLVMVDPAHVFASQNISGQWVHNSSKGTESTDQQRVNYSLNLGQDLTDLVSLSEAFRYSQSRNEGVVTENYDPSLSFSVNNYLFLFDLDGRLSQRKNSNSADTQTRSWQSSWSSKWDKLFWPTLRLSYGEDYKTDDRSPSVNDTESFDESASVNWDLQYCKLNYNFNLSDSTDNVRLTNQQTSNHSVRFDTDGVFLDQKLRLGFAQQYTLNNSESSVTVGGGGTAAIKQSISQVLAGTDVTPLLSSVGELTAKGFMLDGNTATPGDVSTDGTEPPPLNIAFAVDYNEVDYIYLYTDENESLYAAAFVFDLYTSTNGTDWVLRSTGISSSYNPTDQRFEFLPASLQVRWLKLVITSSSAAEQVDFTEIEVYDEVAGSSSSVTQEKEQSSLGTDFNLGYTISPAMAFSYNFSMKNTDLYSGLTSEASSHAGMFRWEPTEYVNSSFGISQNQDKTGAASESLGRNYTMSFGSQVLPTVNMNLGLTRGESYEDGSLGRVSQSAGLLTTAQLYPDLDGRLNLNYNNSKNEVSGSSSKGYDSSLNLTARLIPRMTASFSGAYRQTYAAATSTDNLDTRLNLNWRRSDILSLSGGVGQSWENSVMDNQSMNINASLAATSKIQTSFGYNYSKSIDQATQAYSFFLSWKLSNHFNFQGNASFSDSGTDDTWAMTGRLSSRFATP